jgi:acyl carrier protein
VVNNTDILNDLAEIVEQVTGVEAAKVTAEKSFADDLDIDSLSMVEITVQVEDRFALRIPDDRVAGLRTVGDAVNYVADHR